MCLKYARKLFQKICEKLMLQKSLTYLTPITTVAKKNLNFSNVPDAPEPADNENHVQGVKIARKGFKKLAYFVGSHRK